MFITVIYYFLGISIFLGLAFVIFKVMLAPNVQKIEDESVDDWLYRSNKDLAKRLVIFLAAFCAAIILIIYLSSIARNLN